MGKVVGLSELHDKYFDLGFRVVAVSDESSKKLEQEMLEVRGATYWLASDPRNKTRGRFVRGDDFGIPRFYLIDARGVVVGNGIPTEERIIELLAETYADLGRELPADLEKVELAYRHGAYGEAWRLAGKALDSKDADVKGAAEYVREKVEAYAVFVEKASPAWLEDKRPEQVYGQTLVISLQFDGTGASKWAQSLLKKWARDEAIKKDKKAWRKLGDAIERDLGAMGEAYERKRARDMYQYVLDKYPYTRASDLAKQRLERFADVK